jgi:hypothetical protein
MKKVRLFFESELIKLNKKLKEEDINYILLKKMN